MKLHLIRKQTIINYTVDNENSRLYFNSWIKVSEPTDWNTPEDILKTFG